MAVTPFETSPSPLAPPRAPELSARRLLWERTRAVMEASGVRFTPLGIRPKSGLLGGFLQLVENGLRRMGCLAPFARTALDVRVVEMELAFPHLPEAFDGYRILHLTDLHLDHIEGIADAIEAAVAPVAADLAVMTGDFRKLERGPHEPILAPLARIAAATGARDGVLATLGNHDDAAMARSMEAIGVPVLVNETAIVERRGARLHLTGLDDVHRFYTCEADTALSLPDGGFGVALVHSPEMADRAAEAGYALYLCGHTHGGQVCLPGGVPIITQLDRNRDLAGGLWRRDAMTGYTGRGAGVSGLALRLFCPGEAVVLTLRRG